MPFSFVLLVDDEAVPAWQARALEELLDSGLARPVLVVEQGRPTARQGRAGLWGMIERRAARSSGATRPVRLPPRFDHVPRLTAEETDVSTTGQRLTQHDLATIAATRPDFIVAFGTETPQGELLTAASHGVWAYHHGVGGDALPGLREMLERSPTTDAALVRLTGNGAAEVLHAGRFPTTFHAYGRQRDQLLWGTSAWLRRTCAALAAGVLIPTANAGAATARPARSSAFAYLFRTARAFAGVHWNSLVAHRQWTLGVIEAPLDRAVDLLGDPVTAARAVRWLPDRREQFLADPFPAAVSPDGRRLRIVAEAYPWRTERGEIAAVDFTATDGFATPEPLWAPPFHCSYPAIVTDGIARWCAPETAEAGVTIRHPMTQAGEIDFTESEPLFPTGLIDPTPFHDGERWWLFASDPAAPNLALNLFFADALGGPWQPHPLNPVKTDIASARPAGRLFRHGDALIRPGQDCSRHYGGAVALNRVVTLTTSDYREEPWRTIAPVPGRYDSGLHTLNGLDGWTVIDGARWTFVATAFRRTLMSKLRRGRGS